jgi:cellulose synthase/poly-beta-1,6-N-acetylglucosamine synthase-like glycosyltransferase
MPEQLIVFTWIVNMPEELKPGIIEQLTTLSAGMIIFWAFAFGFLVQLFYHLYFFIRVTRYKPGKQAENLPPVSVIICARNEDDNLTLNLPLILSQDYPDFEVVVVNDCSYDLTGDVLEEFGKKNPKLKIVTIKEDEYYQHGKKVAVMMGIKGAKHEHLVLTDADCRPAGDQWLRKMAADFDEKTEIVLGYGPYEKTKGLLNKLIRFDTFFIALQYLSYSLARVTYMGVGRNLAYRKELFYRKKGFASHYHIQSGDDDLFVNEAATKSNTRVELDASSFCYSASKKSVREWWFQKKRHLQTGKRYKFSHKFLLGLYVLSQWIFLGCFIAALILWFQPYIVLGAFVLRLSIQMLIFNFAMKRMGERDLLFLAPFMEIFFMLFYPVITLSRIFQRKRKWN